MPWNPELINTEVSIFRPDRSGPGGDIVGTPATVASKIPGIIETRDQSVRRGGPVPTASIGERVDLWIQGVDGDGDLLDVRQYDLVEWLTYLNSITDRWEIANVLPYQGPSSGGVPTIDHIKIEARP